ncbi:hypothetical protein J3R82DRAFT_9812 [Butyriboletus roseoflavus]|nr:hypothetical protein J3R82DRAFT_9812 [Butyriboletus roseoflavus]
MFIRYVLLLSSLLSSVSALPLALRDVVSPPITSPTAASVWVVGQTQTVTWSTTGLPVNQTNPVGMLVLGYLYNNSENLMLNSPLATNLNYSVGQAQVTVPNVPSRTDYIVVLFGDSGNASPEFTIINDAAASTSVPPIPLPASSAGSSSPAASTPASTPPANSNSPSSSGVSPPTPITGSPLPSGVLPTTTAPSSQTAASSSSPTLVTVTSSTTPSPTQSNAAWQKHTPSLRIPLGVTLACIYFTFS